MIEPQENGYKSSKPQILRIDRTTYQISQENELPSNRKGIKEIQAFGIIGLINLLVGPCLLLISERRFIGNITGIPIYSIQGVKFIPLNANSTSNLQDSQKRAEATYKSIIESLLTDGYFYFSYILDLTTSLKRVYTNYTHGISPETLSLSQLATGEFFWNFFMLDFFRQFEIQVS